MKTYVVVLIRNAYLLEMPQWGTSNEYPQHKLLCRTKKNINTFFSEKKKTKQKKTVACKKCQHKMVAKQVFLLGKLKSSTCPMGKKEIVFIC